ncbi:hypothetical protein ACFCW2_06610 [Qipengyuania sp. DSG2-2]|uniref:hypothetical protein n=1 Tax=Qipengyuania sp. DGS2-2 TaxID=3349631 RepID=UPI0036D219C2
MRLILPVLSAALLSAVPAQAQAQAEDEVLDYQSAMRCSAVYAFMSAMGEDEQDAETIAAMDEFGQRWLIMAMERDGEDGTRAIAELEPVAEALVSKVEELGEAEAEAFLIDHLTRCDTLEETYSEEFYGIDLE